MKSEAAMQKASSAALSVGSGFMGEELTDEQLVNVEVSDHFVQLKEGAWCRGIFEGPGPTVEVTDTVTGELQPKGSYRFRMENGKGTFIILEKAGLKRQLSADKVGKTLLVSRGRDEKKDAKNIGTYTVGIVTK